MYVRQLTLRNIRAIESFELAFDSQEAPGWHVLLGANGAGKSSIIRSLALVLAGPREAAALRQTWATWVRRGSTEAGISASVDCDKSDVFTGIGRRSRAVELELQFRPEKSSIAGERWTLQAGTDGNLKAKAERSVWGTNAGWFSASFGPFRRFSGGDKEYDRLFLSNPKLAPHLSAFGEDVALTEGLRWLRDLRVKHLENVADAGTMLERVKDFLNASQLLPHGAVVEAVTSEEVRVVDGGGTIVAVEQLSDGYRSVLSMIFEVMRQMARSYGEEAFLEGLDTTSATISLPGVIAIDEVDAHLHPSWQNQIGAWFIRHFPNVQFLVTTHSPIVCRNARTIWRLPSPGTDETAGRVSDADFDRLTKGSIIDAYGTELFGYDVAAPDETKRLRAELAGLNQMALRKTLTDQQKDRMKALRRALPTKAASV